MNPVITKMDYFAIIINSIQPFTIVAKGFILNVVGFLDPCLPRNKLLQKQSAVSNLNRWLCIHAYLKGKYLSKLEKHMLGSLILLNLQHYNHNSLSYDPNQNLYIIYCRKQSQGFLLLDNLSALTQGNCKILLHCFISPFNLSFHNLFHLVHGKLHDEANICTL